jgi:CheY-like chemotaxis protein
VASAVAPGHGEHDEHGQADHEDRPGREDQQVRVAHAASGGPRAEVLTLAGTAAPDLVVLDLGLPDVPGETVAASCAPRRPRPS